MVQQSPLPPPLLSHIVCVVCSGFIVFTSKLKHIMYLKQNTQKFSLISSRFNCCFFIYLLFLFERSVCSRSILFHKCFFHILFALNVYFVKKNVTQQLLSINERKKKKGCLKLFILKRTQSNAETFEWFYWFFLFFIFFAFFPLNCYKSINVYSKYQS